VRHRKIKREKALRGMKKRTERRIKREELVRQRAFLGDNEIGHLTFLVNCLSAIHANVFGSEIKILAEQGFIKYVLEARDFLCFISFDPPANCIPGYSLPVGHSMFFAGFLKGVPPLNGKKVRGMYAVNTDALKNKWLANIQKGFPDLVGEARASVERANILQLVAHEVRHEVQYFSKPKFHKISEIKDLRPDLFLSWQKRTLSVFRAGLSQDMINRDEDAIVTEILVQHLCKNYPEPNEDFFRKVASLVQE